VLRLAGKGRLETGADADLVVLDDQHRVTDVMAMGVWHVKDGEAIVRGLFEVGQAGE
jgi:beta-aspartyl-dipeptidase (metallo-type)